jgi:hypothetical protein
VQQVAGPVYAFALADANELAVWDVEIPRLLFRQRFLKWPLEGLFGLARALPIWRGNSTQALSLTPDPSPGLPSAAGRGEPRSV